MRCYVFLNKKKGGFFMIELIKGDCLVEMQNIADKSIDAIITDPPYGTTSCKWDSVIPFDLMWEQLNRIIKPNGAIVLFGSEPFSSALRMSNIENYKYDWKWQKEKGANIMQAKVCPLKNYEDILVFSDGNICATSNNKIAYYPQGLKNTSKKVKSVMKSSGVHGNRNTKEYELKYTNYPNSIIKFHKGRLKHPTQKPIELMEYLIHTYTNENETVLDFTMGSGTTGVSCKNLNRNFIGIELDDKYFEIAQKRINETQVQTKLF